MVFKSWIIQETNWWVAINKPSGLIVERSPFEENTIEAAAWPYLEKTGKGKNFLGIVHRLDRVTSGVLILAKRKAALKDLNQQFAERTVQKEYLAIVEGQPEMTKGTLKHFLVKDQAAKLARVHTMPKPKSSTVQLHYEILENDGKSSLLRIRPLTGKFHQIRAQLAAIGHPIVGDTKYGGSGLAHPREIALHASQLTFMDPQEKKQRVVKVAPTGALFDPFARYFAPDPS